MAIQDFRNTFRIQDNAPIDTRFVVTTEAERLGFPTGVYYEGLWVHQTDNDTTYVLIDLSQAANADGWKRLDGEAFLSGSGAPTATLGDEGDTYMDTQTGEVYNRINGVWVDSGATLRGRDGAMGADGRSATVNTGTTTTGLPGTDAMVTNSGTTSDAIFNFVIPRGEQGERGPAGSGSQIAIEDDGVDVHPNQMAAFSVINFTTGISATPSGSNTNEVDISADTPTAIDNLNSTSNLQFWTGTLAEYEALTPDPNTLYTITDDGDFTFTGAGVGLTRTVADGLYGTLAATNANTAKVGLPTTDTANTPSNDAGRIPVVQNDGSYVLQANPSGVPTPDTSANPSPDRNQILVVQGDGTYALREQQKLSDLGVTASVTEVNILDNAIITTTELNYLDDVSSNVQTQLDGKASLASPDFTGAIDVTASSQTATLSPTSLVVPGLPGNGTNLAYIPNTGQIVRSGAGHPVGLSQTSLAISDLTGLADGTIASTPTTNLVYVDIDLTTENNFLFHTGTQAFTVPNGNFGVLRGEYVLLGRTTQATTNDPWEISQTTYFVGRVEDFRVNITESASTFQFPAMGTMNVIGAQGTIPAQTVRLAMSEIALSNELAQNVAGLAMITDWFIRPADALDSLGNIRSARQPYTNISWFGDFNGFTPPSTANTSRDVRIRLSRDASNNEIQHVVAAPAFAFGATLPQPADSSAGDLFYLTTAGQQVQRVALTAGGTAVTFDGVETQTNELGAGTSSDGQTGPITRVEWSAGRSTWDDFTNPTNPSGNAFTGDNTADTGTSFGIFLADGTELIWAASQNAATGGVPADRLDWLRGDFNGQTNVALFNDVTTTRQVGLYVFTTEWLAA